MLSVVIVSFNTRELLRQCLESLRRHEPSAQVIVVDNASRDGSPDIVCGEFSEVVLIRSTVNVGFAAANNLGLRAAVGDPVVLLNSDTLLNDDALSRCAAWLDDHPRTGAVSPRLVGADGKPQECLLPFPTLGQRLRTAIRRRWKPADPAKGWLAGTALVLRRSALDAVGGELDAGYFIYWEDADLSARLRRHGWQREVHPEATIVHFGGGSGGGTDAERRADLYAWYCYGEHRWFARNRPMAEAAAVWLFDVFDVIRRRLRAWWRNRPAEMAHARVLARVLIGLPFGWAPRKPG
jgi:GT2 family glycosyltransferase